MAFARSSVFSPDGHNLASNIWKLSLVRRGRPKMAQVTDSDATKRAISASGLRLATGSWHATWITAYPSTSKFNGWETPVVSTLRLYAFTPQALDSAPAH